MLDKLSCLVRLHRDYYPLALSCFVIFLGWWLMLIMTTVQLEVTAPDLSNFKPAGEALARMKVGVTVLIFVTVSFGVAIFSAAHFLNRSSCKQKCHWCLVTFVYFALTNASLFYLDCIYGIEKYYCKFAKVYKHSFLDTFGVDSEKEKNIFELTIGNYPELLQPAREILKPNFLEILERFNFWIYFVAVVAGILLFSAACTLTPKRTYAILRHGKKHSNVRIESAIRQINKQLRWLKYYIFSGALLFISALIYLNASREWPLAYFPTLKTGNIHADTFENIVRSTVLFQAGHFVLILGVAFLPIALRLKFAGERLAQLVSYNQNLTNTQKKTWMANRGLLLTMGETLQQTLAIASPFLVPVVGLIVDNLLP